MTVVPFSVVGNWSTAGLISTTALPPSVSSLVIVTVYFSPPRRTSPLAGNSCRPSWREFAGAAVEQHFGEAPGGGPGVQAASSLDDDVECVQRTDQLVERIVPPDILARLADHRRTAVLLARLGLLRQLAQVLDTHARHAVRRDARSVFHSLYSGHTDMLYIVRPFLYLCHPSSAAHKEAPAPTSDCARLQAPPLPPARASDAAVSLAAPDASRTRFTTASPWPAAAWPASR